MSTSRDYRRFVDTAGAAVGKLARGIPLGRRLTSAERRCLAIASARPTNFLTLNSKSFEQDQIGPAWSMLHKRIERQTRRPLVYYAVRARSYGDGGFHSHLLLWDYLHAPSLHGHAPGVGFGKPHIDQIGPTVEDKLWTTAYVCGQTEPIFGSEYHLRHQKPEKRSHRHSRTSNRVLVATNPQLLSALKMAESRFVSDQELVEMLPRFISTYTDEDQSRPA
jgi:hypothetical protein